MYIQVHISIESPLEYNQGQIPLKVSYDPLNQLGLGFPLFPLEVNLWWHILDKITKNCIKISKSTFWRQNSGEEWREQANFSGSRNPVGSYRNMQFMLKYYARRLVFALITMWQRRLVRRTVSKCSKSFITLQDFPASIADLIFGGAFLVLP